MSDVAFDARKICEIVDNINVGLYEQLKNEDIYLEFISNGDHHIIKFIGLHIWDSENDERDYIDEETDIKEDLEKYIKQIIEDFNKILQLIDWEKI